MKAIRKIILLGAVPSQDNPHRGIFNFRLAQGLKKFADVEVIHLRSLRLKRKVFEQETIDGIHVHRISTPMIPHNYTWSLLLIDRFARKIVENILKKGEILHSIGAHQNGILGSRWSKRFGIPHITQVIGIDIDSVLPKTKDKYPIKGHIQYFDGILCNSKYLEDKLRTLYPDHPASAVLYRGVNLHQFHPHGEKARFLKDIHGPKFLYLGGFSYGNKRDYIEGKNLKGGMTLLKAWQKVESELHSRNAYLFVAGPESISSETKNWHEKLQYGHRVFLGGLLAPHQIPKLMRSFDIVLIPSLKEGLPNIGMEAMASGCAVIGSDIGGIPEIVTPGTTGEILPAGNAEAWGAQLLHAAKEIEHFRSLGIGARKWAEKYLNADDYSENVFKFYQQVLHVNEPSDNTNQIKINRRGAPPNCG